MQEKKVNYLFRLNMVIILFMAVQINFISAQDQSTLKEAFKDHFLIGAAINEFQTSGKDEISLEIIKKQFNQVTPENIMKWERIHPKQDAYNFGPADKLVEFASENNLVLIGHTLTWHAQTPRWVFQDSSGKPVTREILLQRMKDHIQTVVGRYKGKIKGWDVVNEALNEDGTLRQSQWYKIIGEDFIEKAFEFAHEADPDAELYYNDYNIENETKIKGAIQIVKNLKSKGIKISGVGVQAHWRIDDPSLSVVENCIKEFAALGVKVMFTELDINVLPTPYNGLTADITLRADYQEKYNPYVAGMPDSVTQKFNNYYQNLFKIFVKYSKDVERVTFWGVTDKNSWLNGWPIRGRTNYPLLFDREGKPKSAFEAVMKTAK